MTADSQSNTSTLQTFLDGIPGALLLIALVAGCYGYTSRFDYLWDDDAYITNNLNLRDFGGLSRMWTHIGATPQYYPITFTSFWAEYQLFGFDPRISHVINLLLHAGSAVLLWTILKRLGVPGAWLAAGIFAVHPINVESVAWIAERKNTLSLAFGLSALLIYLRYAGLIAKPEITTQPALKPKKPSDADDAEDEEGLQLSLPDDPARLYALFLVLYACALLSKTTLSVLPGVILVILWWKRGKIVPKDLVPLIAPIVLGLIGAGVTSYVEHNAYLVGAGGREWSHGVLDRLALAGQASWFYVGKLLTPHPFVLGAPSWNTALTNADAPGILLNVPEALKPYLPGPLTFNYEKWPLNAGSILQWLGTIGVMAIIAALWFRRSKIGRGALACVLVYLGCLIPAMGFFNVYPMRFSWVADHFAYVAGIGLIVLFAAGATRLLGRFRIAAPVMAGALIVLLGTVTVLHSLSFKNADTLWIATLLRNDRSWLAAANLGGFWRARGEEQYLRLSRQGKLPEAEKAYIDCGKNARRWLNYAEKLNDRAYEVYYQLALLQKGLNKTDEALGLALQSDQIAIEEGSKTFIYPRLLIAGLLMQKGDPEKAKQIYLDLQQLEPKIGDKLPTLLADARMRVAEMQLRRLSGPIRPDMSTEDLHLLGDVIEQLTVATELAPAWAPPKLRLARIMIDLDNAPQAIQLVLQVLTLDKYNLEAKYVSALLALKQKDYQKAGAQLSDLIQRDPTNIVARVKFAETLHLLNRDTDAIEQLNEALKINPDDADAKKLLGELSPAATQPATKPSAR